MSHTGKADNRRETFLQWAAHVSERSIRKSCCSYKRESPPCVGLLPGQAYSPCVDSRVRTAFFELKDCASADLVERDGVSVDLPRLLTRIAEVALTSDCTCTELGPTIAHRRVALVRHVEILARLPHDRRNLRVIHVANAGEEVVFDLQPRLAVVQQCA